MFRMAQQRTSYASLATTNHIVVNPRRPAKESTGTGSRVRRPMLIAVRSELQDCAYKSRAKALNVPAKDLFITARWDGLVQVSHANVPLCRNSHCH